MSGTVPHSTLVPEGLVDRKPGDRKLLLALGAPWPMWLGFFDGLDAPVPPRTWSSP